MDIKVTKRAEVTSVCKAWDDHYESGRKLGKQEGLEEGMKMGLEMGLKKGIEKGKRSVLQSLVSEGFISEELAAMKMKHQ